MSDMKARESDEHQGEAVYLVRTFSEHARAKFKGIISGHFCGQKDVVSIFDRTYARIKNRLLKAISHVMIRDLKEHDAVMKRRRSMARCLFK